MKSKKIMAAAVVLAAVFAFAFAGVVTADDTDAALPTPSGTDTSAKTVTAELGSGNAVLNVTVAGPGEEDGLTHVPVWYAKNGSYTVITPSSVNAAGATVGAFTYDISVNTSEDGLYKSTVTITKSATAPAPTDTIQMAFVLATYTTNGDFGTMTSAEPLVTQEIYYNVIMSKSKAVPAELEIHDQGTLSGTTLTVTPNEYTSFDMNNALTTVVGEGAKWYAEGLTNGLSMTSKGVIVGQCTGGQMTVNISVTTASGAIYYKDITVSCVGTPDKVIEITPDPSMKKAGSFNAPGTGKVDRYVMMGDPNGVTLTLTLGEDTSGYTYNIYKVSSTQKVEMAKSGTTLTAENLTGSGEFYVEVVKEDPGNALIVMSVLIIDPIDEVTPGIGFIVNVA